MKRSRFSEEQIIGTLEEAEAGTPVADLCRRLGISEGTLDYLRAKRLCFWHGREFRVWAGNRA